MGSETVRETTVKVRSTLRFLGPDVLAQVQLPGFSLWWEVQARCGWGGQEVTPTKRHPKESSGLQATSDPQNTAGKARTSQVMLRSGGEVLSAERSLVANLQGIAM